MFEPNSLLSTKGTLLLFTAWKSRTINITKKCFCRFKNFFTEGVKIFKLLLVFFFKRESNMFEHLGFFWCLRFKIFTKKAPLVFVSVVQPIKCWVLVLVQTVSFFVHNATEHFPCIQRGEMGPETAEMKNLLKQIRHTYLNCMSGHIRATVSRVQWS